MSLPKAYFKFVLANLLLCANGLASLEKPNVVVILADDFGLGDVGRDHTARTGNAPLAPTPAIDSLANEGLWFTDAHSPAALCAPTRFAVMTGNYNYRSIKPGGVWGTFDLNAIATTDTTLGSLAKSAGYTTGFVGKWHLGGDFFATGTNNITRQVDDNSTPAQVDMSTWIDRGPQNLGFDYDFTVACGVQGPTYVAHENGTWYPWEVGSSLIFYDNANFVADKGPGIGDSNWDATELNMLLADKAAAFIASSAASNDPFMLYYCSPAVHLPHTPPTSIDGDPIAGTTPSPHLDMNRVLDLEVKKIVDALKAAGEYNNTLIIFTSDNGGLYDSDALAAGHNSSGGYRGTKNSAFEGGQRVPFIAVWPSVITASTTSNALVNGTDILATIAETMEASFPNDQGLDSHSLFPLFLGNTSYEPRSELMQQGGSGSELMLRQGDWKLIIESNVGHNDLTQADTTATKLFNLSTNPTEAEASNLINDPAQASRVTSMFNRYWEVRNNSARSAPTFGATINTTSTLFGEDFSSMTSGDSASINNPISNGSYDTTLDTSNHAVASIVTNAGFGVGNVLQVTTGPNTVLTQGFGSISNKNDPLSVTLNVGDQITLAFDMLVQAVPASTGSLNIQLRNTSNNSFASRTFTELSDATVDDVVSFSWTVDVDSSIANESDIYFWIPVEGLTSNFDTEGPNGDGTDLDVMQLDNISLTQSTTSGYQEFANNNDLTGAKTGDDDGDSLSNVLEYAFGSDPTDRNSTRNISSQIIENGGYQFMEIQYSRRKSAKNFSALRIWRATDLANPDWELGTTQLISVTDDSNDASIENIIERSTFSTDAVDKAFFIMDAVVSP
ncbi:MAG: Arylsulfatase [Opitutia bacterium UBA7350]|nr:MAG: Arylsulfatase [Opitutae bacterium UBA7350]